MILLRLFVYFCINNVVFNVVAQNLRPPEFLCKISDHTPEFMCEISDPHAQEVTRPHSQSLNRPSNRGSIFHKHRNIATFAEFIIMFLLS